MISEQLQENPLIAVLDARFPGIIESAVEQHGQTILYITPAHIVEVCTVLRDEHGFIRASSITALDWYPQEPRFEVVYLLHSIKHNLRIRLKCRVSGENPSIDSICSVWAGANWYEREVFDLFGIQFLNHPDLRRIMMPEGWEGHPLRKDFPVHGHKYDYGEGTH
ncbi:NADH-quinone oxidoreductase subunit C [Bryobacter aggregatus]|uniref:NADH-quinone oxidoreductase subunit C n=1 Tax=Bryobacter aggregatus TaxID=360054 RepID=UPI0004E105F7|nr:NADH-quinone oxidoreductase subunit C [Bryobacter aggregatus]